MVPVALSAATYTGRGEGGSRTLFSHLTPSWPQDFAESGGILLLGWQSPHTTISRLASNLHGIRT